MINVLSSGIIIAEKQRAYCHCIGYCTDNDIDYFMGYLDGTYDALNS